jgi:dGTPase
MWEKRRADQPKRSSDVRDEFDRDYSRLIHSPAFRRLQAKTQVLGLGESDFYRTRLTHSMEVAQIGSGITQYLRVIAEKNGDAEVNKMLPSRSLIETICLAHDIGHPPFGHGGEIALNICMKNDGGFEGNGQTLRILSKLDKYMDGYGLNPTRRSLMGVLKYPTSFEESVNKEFYPANVNYPQWLVVADKFKPPKCYFDADKNVVDWILEDLSKHDRNEFIKVIDVKDKPHRKSVYKSLDTSIMELADDISYGVHDLEDGIALGMISESDWIDFFSGRESVFENLGMVFNDVTNELFKGGSNRKQMVGELVNCFITRVVVKEVEGFKFQEGLLKFNAYLPENSEMLLKDLQGIVVEFLIKNENVQHLEFKGQKLVVELFNVFANDPDRLLPKQTKKIFIDADRDIRVISDYVSGMTDDYAIRQYEKLFTPRKGSVFERL